MKCSRCRDREAREGKRTCDRCGHWRQHKVAPPATTPAPVEARAVAERCEEPVFKAPMNLPTSGLAAILSDVHAPQEDEAAVAAVLAWIAAEHPAVIVLAGDIGEWESCSQHGGVPVGVTLQNDVAEVHKHLRRIRKAAPEARILYLEGNHETRLARVELSLVPTLAGVKSIPELLGLGELGIEWVPEGAQPIRLGTLVILHGHQVFGEKYGPKYPAAKLVEVYGEAGHTVVGAHVHRDMEIPKPMLGGQARGVTLPCLRELRPKWLHGQEAGWCHGFGIATLREGFRTSLEIRVIEDGEFTWGGKLYQG